MKNLVIVEGKHDYTRIKQIYPELPVLITNGSAISLKFLKQVKKLTETYEVILLLDPDYPGEKIRKTIMDYCPNVGHAFVRQKDARSKNGKKVGVEHVELDILKEVLNKVSKADYHQNINIQDIYDLGLAGTKESKKRREIICDKFNLGHVNAKQIVKRLNLFNITLDEIKEAL